jgi:hypothetical protein
LDILKQSFGEFVAVNFQKIPIEDMLDDDFEEEFDP